MSRYFQESPGKPVVIGGSFIFSNSFDGYLSPTLLKKYAEAVETDDDLSNKQESGDELGSCDDLEDVTEHDMFVFSVWQSPVESFTNTATIIKATPTKPTIPSSEVLKSGPYVSPKKRDVITFCLTELGRQKTLQEDLSSSDLEVAPKSVGESTPNSACTNQVGETTPISACTSEVGESTHNGDVDEIDNKDIISFTIARTDNIPQLVIQPPSVDEEPSDTKMSMKDKLRKPYISLNYSDLIAFYNSEESLLEAYKNDEFLQTQLNDKKDLDDEMDSLHKEDSDKENELPEDKRSDEPLNRSDIHIFCNNRKNIQEQGQKVVTSTPKASLVPHLPLMINKKSVISFFNSESSFLEGVDAGLSGVTSQQDIDSGAENKSPRQEELTDIKIELSNKRSMEEYDKDIKVFSNRQKVSKDIKVPKTDDTKSDDIGSDSPILVVTKEFPDIISFYNPANDKSERQDDEPLSLPDGNQIHNKVDDQRYINSDQDPFKLDDALPKSIPSPINDQEIDADGCIEPPSLSVASELWDFGDSNEMPYRNPASSRRHSSFEDSTGLVLADDKLKFEMNKHVKPPFRKAATVGYLSSQAVLSDIGWSDSTKMETIDALPKMNLVEPFDVIDIPCPDLDELEFDDDLPDLEGDHEADHHDHSHNSSVVIEDSRSEDGKPIRAIQDIENLPSIEQAIDMIDAIKDLEFEDLDISDDLANEVDYCDEDFEEDFTDDVESLLSVPEHHIQCHELPNSFHDNPIHELSYHHPHEGVPERSASQKLFEEQVLPCLEHESGDEHAPNGSESAIIEFITQNIGHYMANIDTHDVIRVVDVDDDVDDVFTPNVLTSCTNVVGNAGSLKTREVVENGNEAADSDTEYKTMFEALNKPILPPITKLSAELQEYMNCSGNSPPLVLTPFLPPTPLFTQEPSSSVSSPQTQESHSQVSQKTTQRPVTPPVTPPLTPSPLPPLDTPFLEATPQASAKTPKSPISETKTSDLDPEEGQVTTNNKELVSKTKLAENLIKQIAQKKADQTPKRVKSPARQQLKHVSLSPRKSPARQKDKPIKKGDMISMNKDLFDELHKKFNNCKPKERMSSLRSRLKKKNGRNKTWVPVKVIPDKQVVHCNDVNPSDVQVVIPDIIERRTPIAKLFNDTSSLTKSPSPPGKQCDKSTGFVPIEIPQPHFSPLKRRFPSPEIRRRVAMFEGINMGY